MGNIFDELVIFFDETFAVSKFSLIFALEFFIETWT